ncbi:heme ABC transporter ATP-binding protein [Microbacterium sp. MPKO10]|uniref:heme ABC transporter ATP-binding protein n=1 Tax=Microbacterium sp. MPKO10 TaxID=2989818 RepID=UPI0022357015|nr:heme ABC transporter ATP-binding protein [Microbacterium sp. MPKO10]MCW4458932.1 heme ABC transporter ATP-binding protein [Microbacterium sp. MPKO10]
MTATLQISDVHVTIEKQTILDGVSLTLNPGRVTAIIGPNGAGKSTLLGVAAGTVKPDAGAVTIAGRDLRRISPRRAARQRAVMPQDTAVAFAFTVREVVMMGRTAWGDSPARSERIARDVLEPTGLLPLADREVTTLSGGERQLVAFARTMAQATPVGPGSILLLDEPTAAMDIAHAEATLTLARSLADAGAAVGIVVHDIDAAAAYADDLVLMHRGRVEAAGPVHNVCARGLLSAVYGTPIDVFERDGRIHVVPIRALAV